MSRYIDADLLKSATVDKNSIWDKITDASGRRLSEIIDSIPTADVQPIVTATWHDDLSSDWICTNCLKQLPSRLYKYCPNCGARMVEE